MTTLHRKTYPLRLHRHLEHGFGDETTETVYDTRVTSTGDVRVTSTGDTRVSTRIQTSYPTSLTRKTYPLRLHRTVING